jgi:sterol desaturase/sphingolipid hydroxylase (fatty acid hydroxylase superfamily)
MLADLSALEDWGRLYSEPLTLGLFFGLFAVLGVVEAIRLPAAGAHRTRRWPLNLLLSVLWAATGALIPVSALALATVAHQEGAGLLNAVALPGWAVLAAGFLLRSLLSYVSHVAMHMLPWLWRIHRVHHLDPYLDVSTTARFHPLEALATAPIVLPGVWLFGLHPAVVLLYELFDAALVVFSHANIRLPERLDRALGWVVMTPDLHRVHHSSLTAETNSNYCATITWWDRLFGTFRRVPRARLDAIEIGLGEVRDARSGSIGWLLGSPLRDLKAPPPRA